MRRLVGVVVAIVIVAGLYNRVSRSINSEGQPTQLEIDQKSLTEIQPSDFKALCKNGNEELCKGKFIVWEANLNTGAKKGAKFLDVDTVDGHGEIHLIEATDRDLQANTKLIFHGRIKQLNSFSANEFYDGFVRQIVTSGDVVARQKAAEREIEAQASQYTKEAQKAVSDLCIGTVIGGTFPASPLGLQFLNEGKQSMPASCTGECRGDMMAFGLNAGQITLRRIFNGSVDPAAYKDDPNALTVGECSKSIGSYNPSVRKADLLTAVDDEAISGHQRGSALKPGQSAPVSAPIPAYQSPAPSYVTSPPIALPEPVSAEQLAYQQPASGYAPNAPADQASPVPPVASGSNSERSAARLFSADYIQGRADRQGWEGWYNALPEGDYKAGATWWASNRSQAVKRHLRCGSTTNSLDFTQGCQTAQGRLATPDARRVMETDYKAGWNSP